MFWIVQQDLYSESGYTRLMETLDRFSIPHAVVKAIPFAYDIEPDIIVDGPVICMGATIMSNVAKKKNWTPGSFLNENFDFSVWRNHMGDELLNFDSRISKYSEVDNYYPQFFIRPCHDDKTFSGKVFSYDEFVTWRNSVLIDHECYTSLNADTMVMTSSLKDILREYRFFVVDGKIVTGSLYKIGNKVNYQSMIDDDILSYAKNMVNKWQPARAFVIDVAVISGGAKKVIEYNNFNSAGFYECDVQKIVMAVEDMQNY